MHRSATPHTAAFEDGGEMAAARWLFFNGLPNEPGRGTLMRIKVRYWDNCCGIVDDSLLDELIREERICAFLRSDGWAVLGRDCVRGAGRDRRRRGSLINIYI